VVLPEVLSYAIGLFARLKVVVVVGSGSGGTDQSNLAMRLELGHLSGGYRRRGRRGRRGT
jgi:hypothetical protein